MKKAKYQILAILFLLLMIGCATTEEKNYSTKTSSIVSNNNRNHLTSEDEEYIYFGGPFAVKKVLKKDNTVEDVFEIKDFSDEIVDVESFLDRLYLLTFSNKLISISKDGNDLEKIELTDIDSPSFYTYDDGLYIVANSTGDVYKLNPEDLGLEEADSAIINQYVAADGTLFIKKNENNLGRVYVVVDGEEKLFSAEEESVVLNRMNFTDSYVFYYSFNMDNIEDFSELDSFSLYRVDLDGKNKKMIKEVELSDYSGNIKYDNEYIYVSISADEYIKIHKETLKETNIIEQIDSFVPISFFEVSNGRFFAYTETNFLDSASGELIEL